VDKISPGFTFAIQAGQDDLQVWKSLSEQPAVIGGGES